jgi:arylsulfatase A-like enzyme
MKRLLCSTLLLAPLATVLAAAEPAPAGKPNILFILADDLGYNDLGCYGATKIKTPRIDRLAGEGVRFTDAHSVCAVCNPSRYSILSGTYLWHAKRKNDYSLYFHDGQVTLPALLKSAGYHTAALGKWHNGFGHAPEPDWNGELKPGPLEVGFDSFFGTPKTHNEPPLVFVEDHHVIGLDPADPIRIDKSQGPHGTMYGGAKARAARPDDRIDFIMAEKAAAFFARQSKGTPFFLYLAFAAPHVPIDPAPEFRGTSQAGLYGDYIQQLDHCTGLVLDALEKCGLAENTLVVFTSDNGGMYTRDALTAGHRCNGSLLGQKTDAWEGGHRVPLVARWAGHIPAASERKALFTQVDFMATLAEAAGAPVPPGASPDGWSEFAAFTSPRGAPARRQETLFLGTGGFALRQGDWLFMPKQGSGGMSVQVPPGPQWGVPFSLMGFVNSDIDVDGQIRPEAAPVQLYNLADDRDQHTNVATKEPERAQAMKKRLEQLLARPKPAGKAKPAAKAKTVASPKP